MASCLSQTEDFYSHLEEFIAETDHFASSDKQRESRIRSFAKTQEHILVFLWETLQNVRTDIAQLNSKLREKPQNCNVPLKSPPSTEPSTVHYLQPAANPAVTAQQALQKSKPVAVVVPTPSTNVVDVDNDLMQPPPLTDPVSKSVVPVTPLKSALKGRKNDAGSAAAQLLCSLANVKKKIRFEEASPAGKKKLARESRRRKPIKGEPTECTPSFKDNFGTSSMRPSFGLSDNEISEADKVTKVSVRDVSSKIPPLPPKRNSLKNVSPNRPRKNGKKLYSLLRKHMHDAAAHSSLDATDIQSEGNEGDRAAEYGTILQTENNALEENQIGEAPAMPNWTEKVAANERSAAKPFSGHSVEQSQQNAKLQNPKKLTSNLNSIQKRNHSTKYITEAPKSPDEESSEAHSKGNGDKHTHNPAYRYRPSLAATVEAPDNHERKQNSPEASDNEDNGLLTPTFASASDFTRAIRLNQRGGACGLEWAETQNSRDSVDERDNLKAAEKCTPKTRSYRAPLPQVETLPASPTAYDESCVVEASEPPCESSLLKHTFAESIVEATEMSPTTRMANRARQSTILVPETEFDEPPTAVTQYKEQADSDSTVSPGHTQERLALQQMPERAVMSRSHMHCNVRSTGNGLGQCANGNQTTDAQNAIGRTPISTSQNERDRNQNCDAIVRIEDKQDEHYVVESNAHAKASPNKSRSRPSVKRKRRIDSPTYNQTADRDGKTQDAMPENTGSLSQRLRRRRRRSQPQRPIFNFGEYYSKPREDSCDNSVDLTPDASMGKDIDNDNSCATDSMKDRLKDKMPVDGVLHDEQNSVSTNNDSLKTPSTDEGRGKKSGTKGSCNSGKNRSLQQRGIAKTSPAALCIADFKTPASAHRAVRRIQQEQLRKETPAVIKETRSEYKRKVKNNKNANGNQPLPPRVETPPTPPNLYKLTFDPTPTQAPRTTNN